MSTLQARTMFDRVVLIHDLPEQTIISELDVEQADVLLAQLQAAVRSIMAAVQGRRDTVSALL